MIFNAGLRANFCGVSTSVLPSPRQLTRLLGGVPVENLSQGYSKADWDTVLGDMF
jgi:hypothetical protein